MTKKKQLQLVERELCAINICIEQNNIIIKPIIRIFLIRLQIILDHEEPSLNLPTTQNWIKKIELSNQNAADLGYRHLTETDKTAFNIE